MLARAVTYCLVGLDARRVEVEAHVRNGLPGFTIVGLADRACQEARERVRSGTASAELRWPTGRITVNLAPAGLRKEGSGFDLPIALAVAAASRQVEPESLPGYDANAVLRPYYDVRMQGGEVVITPRGDGGRARQRNSESARQGEARQGELAAAFGAEVVEEGAAVAGGAGVVGNFVEGGLGVFAGGAHGGGGRAPGF